MIGAVFAAAVALAPAQRPAAGEWLVVKVERVIAPDQQPGECFVQGKVEQVVRGAVYRAGDAVALTVPCRQGGVTPARWSGEAFGPEERLVGQEPPTLETLRSQRRALVHVDAGGRLLDNGYWGLGAALRLAPGPLR